LNSNQKEWVSSGRTISAASNLIVGRVLCGVSGSSRWGEYFNGDPDSIMLVIKQYIAKTNWLSLSFYSDQYFYYPLKKRAGE